MNAMYRLRLSHAALAMLATAVYLTGESGAIHEWLGYGILIVIIIRIAMAFTGAPQLGLMRFYPSFEGMKLGNFATHPAISRTLLAGIAICLIGAVTTGVMMDKGETLGFAAQLLVPAALADSDNAADLENSASEDRNTGEKDEQENGIGEIHETFSNILLILVGLHIAYLLAFKRPIARFMLFAAKPARSSK